MRLTGYCHVWLLDIFRLGFIPYCPPSQGWSPCLVLCFLSLPNASWWFLILLDWFRFLLNTPLMVSVKYCHIKCSADQRMLGEVGWMWCGMFKSLQLYYTASHGLFCLLCCCCCYALCFKNVNPGCLFFTACLVCLALGARKIPCALVHFSVGSFKKKNGSLFIS